MASQSLFGPKIKDKWCSISESYRSLLGKIDHDRRTVQTDDFLNLPNSALDPYAVYGLWKIQTHLVLTQRADNFLLFGAKRISHRSAYGPRTHAHNRHPALSLSIGMGNRERGSSDTPWPLSLAAFFSFALNILFGSGGLIMANAFSVASWNVEHFGAIDKNTKKPVWNHG